jgi:uncharacterized protein YcnI
MSVHITTTVARRPALRVAAVALTTLGLAGLGTTAAQAHVTARGDSTAPGSFSQVTFRVPNESDSAGTVKVAVELPQTTPFAFVSVKPVPGWSVEAKEAPLPAPVEAEGATLTKAVRTVTWTADKGTQIAPGEYQDFSISAGPPPEEGTLAMPATQTYSDGEVVAWDEATPASGEEPERPAPTLTVTAATTAEGGAAVAPAPAEAAPAPAAAGVEPDTTARWLGGLALVVAVGAAALGALGLRRRTAA